MPFYKNTARKKIIFLIFIIAVVGMVFPQSKAVILPKTGIELYLEHDIIFLGKVIDFNGANDGSVTPRTNYQVSVIQPIKGEFKDKEMEIVGLGFINATRHLDNETIYQKNQEVVFMLNEKDDGRLFISPYSTSSESQNPNSEFVLPPLKLFKAGISISDIHCKSFLKFAIKTVSLAPVCIKPDSYPTLLQRGWIR